MGASKPAIFPSIYRDFVKLFPDDAACAAHLERLRWPNGFVCPACHQPQKPWRQSRGRLVCPACAYQSTVTAGTIFDKTRTPLTTWANSLNHMVRCRLAHHHGKKWHVRQDPRTHNGNQLSCGLDDAPSISGGDGSCFP